jgi:TolA-binding protein
MPEEKRKEIDRFFISFIKWIGSFASLMVHTLLFIFCFLTGMIWGHWDSILLVLTTLVSLEAIYLSIFIQMSVNRNTESLQAVEKDIDEIQEDVEDVAEDVDKIHENVEDIAEDVDELQEDVEGLQEDDKLEESQEEQDKRLMKDIQDNLAKISADLEMLKKK